MSKTTKQPSSVKTGSGSVSGKKFEMALHKENYILLAVAFVIVVIGFLLMTGASNNDPEVFNEEIYGFRRLDPGAHGSFIWFYLRHLRNNEETKRR